MFTEYAGFATHGGTETVWEGCFSLVTRRLFKCRGPRGATGPQHEQPQLPEARPQPQQGLSGCWEARRLLGAQQVPALDCSEWLVLALLGFLMTDFFKKNFFFHIEV